MDDMWPCDAVVGNTAASCLCAGLCTEKPDRSCSAAQQAIQLLRAAGLSRGTKNKHYGLSTITDYHYHFSSARLVCKVACSMIILNSGWRGVGSLQH